jgi:DNA-binding winged helix-turn-helix (wHTH) protein
MLCPDTSTVVVDEPAGRVLPQASVMYAQDRDPGGLPIPHLAMGRVTTEAPTSTSADLRRSVHAIQEGGASFEFGRFRVLPRKRQLFADGTPVDLGTRAFDVLMALIEAHGKVVTKHELLDRVWPGTFVQENNIQVQISALRKAFGEDRNLILTVPLRGYLFTGHVRRAAAEPDAASAQRLAASEADEPALVNFLAAVSDLSGRGNELRELQHLNKGVHDALVLLSRTLRTLAASLHPTNEILGEAR